MLLTIASLLSTAIALIAMNEAAAARKEAKAAKKEAKAARELAELPPLIICNQRHQTPEARLPEFVEVRSYVN